MAGVTLRLGSLCFGENHEELIVLEEDVVGLGWGVVEFLCS